MPNYCYNSLSIEGTNETLAKIRDLMNGEDNVFDFQKIIPMPADVEDWYAWRCENWGTKWNSCDAYSDGVTDCLGYCFDTAWGPCKPIIKALATMFPDTKIFYSYSEAGMCFCGKQEFENGRMTYSAEGDYGEYWFDGYSEDDEDEREILKEKDHPGIFYTVIQEEDLGPVTATKFSYRDNDNERSIQIEGVSYDARAERKPFVW